MAAAVQGPAEYASFRADQAQPGTWIITVVGEVDFANFGRFRAVVDQVLCAGPIKLIFDLAGVRFMDSAGLSVLLAPIHRTAVAIRDPSLVMERLIQVTGLVEILRVGD